MKLGKFYKYFRWNIKLSSLIITVYPLTAGSILISVIFVPIICTFSVNGKMPKKLSKQMQVKISVTQADFLIQEYSTVLDSGAISQQDFDNKKAYILSKMA